MRTVAPLPEMIKEREKRAAAEAALDDCRKGVVIRGPGESGLNAWPPGRLASASSANVSTWALGALPRRLILGSGGSAMAAEE